MRHKSMVALMTSCILLAGCRERPTGAQRNGGSARIVRLDELTEAEKRYGHSAKPSRGYLPARRRHAVGRRRGHPRRES